MQLGFRPFPIYSLGQYELASKSDIAMLLWWLIIAIFDWPPLRVSFQYYEIYSFQSSPSNERLSETGRWSCCCIVHPSWIVYFATEFQIELQSHSAALYPTNTKYSTYILARLLDFGSAHVAATKRELTLSTVKSLKSLFVVVKITFEHQSHRELFHTDMCDFMCDFMLDISEFVNRRSYGDHTSLFRGFLHHIVYRFPAYLCYYFSFRVA